MAPLWTRRAHFYLPSPEAALPYFSSENTDTTEDRLKIILGERYVPPDN